MTAYRFCRRNGNTPFPLTRKGSLETIRSTAANLIDTIDGHFAAIQKAQDKEQTTEQAQPAQEATKQPEAEAATPELPEETAPVQEKETQPEQAAPAAPYYPINEAAAKRAKDMNSLGNRSLFILGS